MNEEAPEAPNEKWTVADLKAYAEENGIDLGEATLKADILAAMSAAPTDTTTTPPNLSDTDTPGTGDEE